MKDSQRWPRREGLFALLAILSAGVGLVALGVSPEGLGTITIALSGLYSVWSNGRDRPKPPDGSLGS